MVTLFLGMLVWAIATDTLRDRLLRNVNYRCGDEDSHCLLCEKFSKVRPQNEL